MSSNGSRPRVRQLCAVNWNQYSARKILSHFPHCFPQRSLACERAAVEAEDGPFLVGIGADELRQIPQRIAVAAGRHKVVPIAAAISGGMISDLITDHTTAAELLQLLLG